MSKPKTAENGNDQSTSFENPQMGSAVLPIPNAVVSSILGAASSEPETEYEKIGNINLNVKRPESEARNDSPNESSMTGLEEEPGTMGSESSESGVDEFLPDAILGSYPDVGDRMFTEVIIGTDDRIRVNPTTSFPWRAICSLKITAANGKRFIGTGWLISPRTVITAGHCVYMHEEGGWARSIEVIPGLNDAARPYGSFVGNVLRSTSGWVSSKNREFDYGAIILPTNARPGTATGTFGFAVKDDAFLLSAALNLSGYPGDKGGNQQWFMAQKAKSVTPKVIYYDIDTYGGQSGAPVWVLQNGVRLAVGIHTNGAASGNSATRIDSSVFTNLQNWKTLGA